MGYLDLQRFSTEIFAVTDSVGDFFLKQRGTVTTH